MNIQERSSKPTAVLWIVLFLSQVVAACSEFSGPRGSSESNPELTPEVAAIVSRHVGLDAEIAKLALELPELGALYHDRSGILHIGLTNVAKMSAAEPKVLAFTRGRLARESVRTSYHSVRYRFLELLDWKDRARSLLGDPGVVFVDLDEEHNRLRIGIVDQAASARVSRALSLLRIPNGAISTELAPRPVPSASLQGLIRPVVGGLQISRTPGTFCTFGFSAVRAGVTGFVTNSHCTAIQGGSESTRFSQPALFTKDLWRVGTELVDPLYFTGAPCPAGKRCRYSDAAFVQRFGSVGYLAQIAVTTVVGSSGPGSIEIARNGVVSGERAEPTLNLFLYKTGRTSGTTGGFVTQTCADYPETSTIVLLCQNVADAYGDFGDSGAAMWWESNSLTNSRPHVSGIMWGITTSPRKVFFSSMGNIRRELGSIQLIF